MGLRVVGLEPDGSRQRLERTGVVAGPPERGTEMVVGVEELRIAFARPFELGDRVSGAALKPVDKAEPVVGDRHARVDADRLGVCPCCGGEIAARFGFRAEQVVASRLGRGGMLLAGNASGKRERDSHPRGVPEHTSF